MALWAMLSARFAHGRPRAPPIRAFRKQRRQKHLPRRPALALEVMGEQVRVIQTAAKGDGGHGAKITVKGAAAYRLLWGHDG